MKNEEEWDALKAAFLVKTTELTNYLQTLSANDLLKPEIARKLADLRFSYIEANLGLFEFAGQQTRTVFKRIVYRRE